MTGLDRQETLAAPALRQALEQAPLALALLLGPEQVFELATSRWLRWMQQESVVGRRLRDALPEFTLGGIRVSKLCEDVYASAQPLSLEQPFTHDGARRLLTFELTPVRGTGGKVLGVLATLSDQTELVHERERAAELARAVSAQRSNMLATYDLLPTALSHYRALREGGQVIDFALAYQNEAAAGVNGFPAGESSTLTMRAMFPALFDTELWHMFVAVVETGRPARKEVRYRDDRMDGWYRLSGARLWADELVVTFEDVTDARRAFEQQHEEAENNEVLLRVARAITGLDIEAIVQAVTDEATAVCHAEFGAFFYNMLDARGESYMLYSLSGVPRSAFEGFPMPRNTAVFGPTFRGEGIVRVADVTVMPEYGQSAPYHGMPPGHLPVRSYLAVPVMSRTGRVLGGLFFGHATPGVFNERHERLVSAIAQQAAVAMDNARLFELARKERALAEEASRMKDDFLATISHELRTPLQSILGWAHMLRSGSLNEENRVRALEAVDRNARAQAALVEDILDVSRIIAGKLRIEVAPVAVAEVVQAALDTVRPAADARSIRLQAVLDPDAGTVMGDANRLQQVIWNLLMNAVKFSSKGGRVYVHLRREQSAVEVVVADEGQGIPAEFLPLIFDRFRQLESGYARKSGGLGLGLSIVKHVVELHGGTVVASSDGLGRGATFTVRIPVAPVLASTLPASAQSLQPAHSFECPAAIEGLRILVVDDEEDARELLRTVLEQCRAKVVTAGSTSEALERLRTSLPDVLVSDIGMPGEDGYALIERVRALPTDAGGRTPAVALTAFARAEDRTRALSRGYNHHVSKPVDLNELLVVIANLMQRFAT